MNVFVVSYQQIYYSREYAGGFIFFIIAGVMFYCPFKFDDDDAGDGLGAWGLFGVH